MAILYVKAFARQPDYALDVGPGPLSRIAQHHYVTPGRAAPLVRHSADQDVLFPRKVWQHAVALHDEAGGRKEIGQFVDRADPDEPS
jgi:hypothetical protein